MLDRNIRRRLTWYAGIGAAVVPSAAAGGQVFTSGGPVALPDGGTIDLAGLATATFSASTGFTSVASFTSGSTSFTQPTGYGNGFSAFRSFFVFSSQQISSSASANLTSFGNLAFSVVQDNYGNAANLASGFAITDDLVANQWGNGPDAFLGAANANFFQNFGFASSTFTSSYGAVLANPARTSFSSSGSSSSASGPFGNTAGLLGFRVTSESGELLYGWFDVELTASDGLQISGWGINAQGGEGLFAGTGQAVPAPGFGALGLLAMGAAGVRRSRGVAA
ncbi:MAG: hypothetical protein AAF108_07225 [Planctomycetota bacterium]